MRSPLHFIFVSVCVFAAVKNSLQRSSPRSSYYTAAVVEYSPYTSGTDLEVFHKNVEIYVEKIQEAAEEPHNADIIVFPECGLVTLDRRVYTRVPSPSSSPTIAPCDDITGSYDNLRNISCAARNHRIYVVINLYEIYPCNNSTNSDYNETCPETGAFYYNTDIVFDRDGKVVARYRKFNLFGEKGIGTPPEADLVTFTTDFGVTFGLFTCFDIMFEKPAVQLVREMNITDIIFPTAWFSELPFLTAVQTQAAWASSMNVNFLGAGYNNPSVGSGGSGIYMGRGGPLKTVMPSSPSTHLLVSAVPKKSGTVGHMSAEDVTTTAGIYMKQDNLTLYKSHLLNLSKPEEQQIGICDGHWCCRFVVSGNKAGEGVSYSYRLMTFNGVRTFDGFANGWMQVCALVACTNETQESCGLTFPAETNVVPTEFHKVFISGDFKKSGSQLPSTLMDNYKPLPASHFSMRWFPFTDDLVTTQISFIISDSPLLTFGIYGRDFSRDSEVVSATTSLTALHCTTLLILATGSFYTSL